MIISNPKLIWIIEKASKCLSKIFCAIATGIIYSWCLLRYLEATNLLSNQKIALSKKKMSNAKEYAICVSVLGVFFCLFLQSSLSLNNAGNKFHVTVLFGGWSAFNNKRDAIRKINTHKNILRSSKVCWESKFCRHQFKALFSTHMHVCERHLAIYSMHIAILFHSLVHTH